MKTNYGNRCQGRYAASLLVAVTLPFAIILASTGGAASWANDSSTAHAARTLNGTDTAHLHLVHQYETQIYEEGSATGALPGRVWAGLSVGATFAGRVTIYTLGGSITGRGSATPTEARGGYQSFRGSLAISSGTGRYRHIHGHGGLYGTFDRETYALVVQTTGSFYY